MYPLPSLVATSKIYIPVFTRRDRHSLHTLHCILYQLHCKRHYPQYKGKDTKKSPHLARRAWKTLTHKIAIIHWTSTWKVSQTRFMLSRMLAGVPIPGASDLVCFSKRNVKREGWSQRFSPSLLTPHAQARPRKRDQERRHVTKISTANSKADTKAHCKR